MSESRVFRVPDDLHKRVEAAYMAFNAKNPVLSMGADERKRRLRIAEDHALIRHVLEEEATPAPEYAKELGFDPDNERIFQRLSRHALAREFLWLVRGWPRSMEERTVFARKTRYSTFVAQCMRQGIDQPGTHHPDFSEGTQDWDPATAKTIARKAFL